LTVLKLLAVELWPLRAELDHKENKPHDHKAREHVQAQSA
jgi:hypothetical protein